MAAALDNVRRHAGPGARAAVRVEYAPDAVSVCVADDGAPSTVDKSTVDGEGSGIAGMRQRADALGGEFRAGPRDRGGFEVYARLPVPGREC